MSIIIQTQRLTLREFKSSDARDLYELNGDPEVLRYTGDKAFESISSAQAFISGYTHYQEHGYGRWGMIDNHTREFVGWCGLKYHPKQAYTDLGYRIKREKWGRGYATEAARASLALAFGRFDLPFVVGRTAKDNLGSVRILEKLGMTLWKQDECHGIPDALIYKITREEYGANGQGSVL